MAHHPLLLRLLAPALLLAGSVLAAPYIVQDPEMLAGLSGTGPGFWPKAMLWGTGVCAALWLVAEVLRPRRGGGLAAEAVPEGTVPPAPDGSDYDMTRAIVGLVFTLLYGVLLPILGFPLATLLFVAAWLFLGRIRRLSLLVLVPVLGTLTLCYVFVLLARMPLERGAGAMGEATVRLYQLLGIY
ncbi:MAG: tripartite tricarboxylate transporter TctB family protein [Geminicoccaceae bacterium]|nr:tripartite tricarboxylate transporter TctB family protein [Geminicoccaceae bacterium]